jgi:hypothetical protein
MGLQKYRSLILIVSAVLALFIASPVLQNFTFFPQTVYFTEFSIFGEYNNATYPANVTAGENYRVYLNVDNHLGSSANYKVEPKFGNQTQFTPDSFNHTNSVLPSLGSITFSAADNQSLQLPVDFSFNYKQDPNNPSQLDVQTVTVNGATITYPITIAWNSAKGGFYGNLFFELWLYNGTANAFEYNQRYVSLWLKMNI